MSFHHVKGYDHYVPFVARRRTHIDQVFTCQMHFTPLNGESAGIAVVQAMNHQYHLQLALVDGVQKVQLLRFNSDYDLQPYFPGFTSRTNRELLAEEDWNGDEIVLQMELHGNKYSFCFGASEEALTELGRADGAAINPEKVGCMVGEMLGLFATGNGTSSENCACFDWAELK